MTFMTRAGTVVELDAVEAWTVRSLRRPAPADDPPNEAACDQGALEFRDWSVFPFEVRAETESGDHYLFGAEARAFVAAAVAGLAPWLRAE